MNKWIFRIFGLLVFLVLGLIAYVEINKEAIVRKIVVEVNKTLTTPLAYKESDVSLLKSFPDLSVSLYDISLKDSSRIEKPLLELEELSIALNIVDVIKNTQDITINHLNVINGEINVIQRKDGSNNYTIMKETSSAEAEQAQLSLSLNDFRIKNVNITYSDFLNNDQYQLTDTNAEGQLKYDNGAISVTSDAKSKVSFGIIRTPMLVSIKSSIDINALYDQIKVNDAQISLNDLPIDLSGVFNTKGDNYDYDFKFASPATDVKKLFSLLPQVYSNQYNDVITSGVYTLGGTLKGPNLDLYPIYKVNLVLKNGQIKYPDLKKSIDHVAFDLDIQNNSGKTYYSSLKIQDLLAKIGNSTIEGMVDAKSVGKSDNISMDVKSNLDLVDLYESFHWTDIEKLEGKVVGALQMATSWDEKTSEMTIADNVFQSDISFKNINYIHRSNGTISIENGLVQSSGNQLNYVVDNMNYPGIDRAFFKGDIKNPLKLLSDSHTIEGVMAIDIQKIDMIALSAGSDTASLTVPYDIPHLNLATTMRIALINYPPYAIEGIQAKGIITDNQSDLSYTIDAVNDNKFYGEGTLYNVIQYGLNNDTLRGKIVLRSNDLVLDKFMTEDESAVDTSSSMIPANLDIDIDYEVTKLSFQNVDLSKAIGDISIANQKIEIKNTAHIFDGDITFTGSFDDHNPSKPEINLNIDIAKISFQETARRLEFFNKILPIASFFEGEYNGTFNWKSALNSDFFPILNSVSSFGEIETKNGGISSFAPIDSVLKFFGGAKEIKEKTWKLDDTKKYFLIEDGKVIVKKVSLKKDDIKVSFEGSHSFEQDIDYDMTVSLPKSKINVDKIYSFIAKTLNLSDQLNGLADDVNIDLVLKLGGKMTKPTFDLKDVRIRKGDIVESIKESALATAKEKKEEVEKTVKDTLNYYKTTVTDSINVLKDKATATVDTIKSEINKEIQNEKEILTKTAGDLLDSIKVGSTDSLASTIDDLFNGQKDKIDKIKDKIKIDIFKKKTNN